MQYKRAKIKGGTYFFTLTLQNRKLSLLTDYFSLLRSSFNKVKSNHRFILDAMVVLPEHLHVLMTLPENDCDYAKRLLLIKAGFSRQLPKLEDISESRVKKGERGIWQRRYWEHCIRDENDFNRHVDYIHYNPVKHGYKNRPIDWEYSTIHKFIRNGILSDNWGEHYQGDFDIKNP